MVWLALTFLGATLVAGSSSLVELGRFDQVGLSTYGASVADPISGKVYVGVSGAILRFDPLKANYTASYNASSASSKSSFGSFGTFLPDKRISLVGAKEILNLNIDGNSTFLYAIASTNTNDVVYRVSIKDMSVVSTLRVAVPTRGFRAAAISDKGDGFGVFQVGNPARDRSFADQPSQQTCIVMGDAVAVPTGVIVAWEFFANKKGSILFQVYRELWKDSNQFTLIGETNVTVNSYGFQRFDLAENNLPAIPVEEGDRIGLKLPSTNAAAITFDLFGSRKVDWALCGSLGVGENIAMQFEQERTYSVKAHAVSFQNSGHVVRRRRGTMADQIEKAPTVGSLGFDGNGGYLKITDIVPALLNNCTLEAWIRLPVAAWDKNATILSQEKAFEWSVSGGILSLSIQSGSLMVRVAAIAIDKSRADQFVHVAATWSGGKVTLYVGGVAAVSATLTNWKQDTSTVGNPIFVGTVPAANTSFFLGQISDVRIWSILRPVSEIMRDHSNRLLGIEMGIVKYMTFHKNDQLDVTGYLYQRSGSAQVPSFTTTAFPPLDWNLVGFADKGGFLTLTNATGTETADRSGIFIRDGALNQILSSTKMAISWSKTAKPTGAIGSYEHAITFDLAQIVKDQEPLSFSGKVDDPVTAVFNSPDPDTVRLAVTALKGDTKLPSQMYTRRKSFLVNSGNAYGLVMTRSVKSLDWTPGVEAVSAVYLGRKAAVKDGFVTFQGSANGFKPSTMAVWFFTSSGWVLVAYGDNGSIPDMNKGSGNLDVKTRKGNYVSPDIMTTMASSSKIGISWSKTAFPTGDIMSYDFAIAIDVPDMVTWTFVSTPLTPAVGSFLAVEARPVKITTVLGSPGLPSTMYTRPGSFAVNYGANYGFVNLTAARSQDWNPDSQAAAALYLGLQDATGKKSNGLIATSGAATSYVPSTMAIWVNFRNSVPSAGFAFVDPSIRFSFRGSVSVWEFFAGSVGNLALQVWRPTGLDTFTLVGSNEVVIREVGRKVISIPIAKRIFHEKGDVIGWMSVGEGLISFDEFLTKDKLDKSRLNSTNVNNTFDGVWSLNLPSTTLTAPSAGPVKFSKKVMRTYSIKGHSAPLGSPVLVMGTYTSPSTVALVSLAETMEVVKTNILIGNNAFLTDAAVDTQTFCALFTVDTSPALVLKVHLSTLMLVESLELTDSFSAVAIVIDPKLNKAFVSSAGLLSRISLEKFQMDSNVVIDKQIASMSLSPSLGMVYLGTTKGQILMISTGGRRELPMELLGQQTVNPSRVISGIVADIPTPAEGGIDVFTLSQGRWINSTVVNRMHTVSKPVLISVVPGCGHISGGTRLVAKAVGLDESARAMVPTQANQPIVFAPSAIDISSGRAEGNIRVVDKNGNRAIVGRAEILHNGTWGTICDDGSFDDREAAMICQAAGYLGGVYTGVCQSYQSASFCGTTASTVWVSNIVCAGWEPSLDYCSKGKWSVLPSTCTHMRDVIVDCVAVASNFAFPTIKDTDGKSQVLVDDGLIFVTTPRVVTAAQYPLSIWNFGTLNSATSFPFRFYDATITGVSPSNIAGSGLTLISIKGTGFVHDPLATARLVYVTNGTATEITGATAILVGTVKEGQIDVSLKTVGLSPGYVFVEVSLDRQYWFRSPAQIAIIDPTPQSVSPLLAPVGGGATITLKGSGFISSADLKIGLFVGKTDKAPLFVLPVKPTLSIDLKSISFVSPAISLGFAAGSGSGPTTTAVLYFGAAFDGQNYKIWPLDFNFYDATFEAFEPAVSHQDGGSLVTITGKGFVKSTSIKIAVKVGTSSVTVAGRYLSGDKVSFRSPAMAATGTAEVTIALNGQQFQKAVGSYEIFKFTTTAVTPSGFQTNTFMPQIITGTGFPTTRPSQAVVNFYVPGSTNAEPILVPATVASATQINVPTNPDVGTYLGPLNIGLSFDGGTRFFDTALNVMAYSCTITSVDPPVVAEGSSTLLSLFGFGFFNTSGKSSAYIVDSVTLDMSGTSALGTAFPLTFVDGVEMRVTTPAILRAGSYAVVVVMGPGQAPIISMKQFKVIPKAALLANS